MSQVSNQTLLFHVDCFSCCIGTCDDGTSVGVVRINKILLAIVNLIRAYLLKLLGACDWQKVKLWLWIASPGSNICQPFETMSAYDDILGWHIDLLSWLTPQKHYISQSFQYNSTRMSSRYTIIVYRSKMIFFYISWI